MPLRKAGQMDAVRISLLLLLLCFGCYWDCEAIVLKIINKEPHSIRICTNETSNVLTLIVCRIRTLRNSREECRLLYREGGEFVHQCDSRFSLKTWNDTVFLYLTSLTPADTGNYTCECSRLDGTYILYLNITVKGVILPSGLTATVLLFIIICGMVKVIHRRHLHCGCVKSEESGSYVHGSGSPTVSYCSFYKSQFSIVS
ncbi:uncharacterized protein LOC119792307 [Cyprinodon tularosa]|uniref:uncharacterized protein LOC119792307 n=1 Tax=Cyprinodon tularosa TaxID=77115 RepID=UPI0018E22355|nr:uncharacterized protein LOC119792307 [Cyprinodon tularosa]